MLKIALLAPMPSANAILLFSESNSRFLCEVPPDNAEAFEAALAGVPFALAGEVIDATLLQVVGIPVPTASAHESDVYEVTAPLVIEAPLDELKAAWQRPLDW